MQPHINLDDLIARVSKLQNKDLQDLAKKAKRVLKAQGLEKWQPNVGPQMEAYLSKADELLFGGEPGGGKSQLCLGLAFNAHRRSLIMRRKYGDLDRIIEDALKIHGSRAGFNGSPPPKLRISDDHIIDFAAAQYVGDEQAQMGKGHDLLAIDEATHFAEQQIRFLMGWVRTEYPDQRTRVVLATNPPMRPEGLWVVKMFAPWLDKRFPHPAQPGELRWYVAGDDGDDIWVDGPGKYPVGDRMVDAKSRTYIPSSVDDNPYYVRSGYKKQLEALPESIRSLLMGGFRTEFRDSENQMIPSAWVRAAIDRWTSRPPERIPMCVIGVDASGGGNDPMVLAIRHDGWYAPMVEIPGKDIPVERAGRHCAGVVISYRQQGAIVCIDMGGGYGSSTYEQLKENEVPVEAFKGAEKSVRRTKDGLMGFANRRSEAYWRFREALDPSQPGGSPIALPDDQLLLADLTSAVIIPDRNTIEMEPKEKVRARLGRSPDRGDAVVMAWSTGPRYVIGGEALARYEKYGHGFAKPRPRVIMGRGRFSSPKWIGGRR